MVQNIRFSSDDHALILNGEPVVTYVSGEIEPSTAENVTPINVASGTIGKNVGPIALSRPGRGSFVYKDVGPDAARIAELSANADDVTVEIRVLKNFSVYSWKSVQLTSATLGSAPLGTASEAADRSVSFSGTGYVVVRADQ